MTLLHKAIYPIALLTVVLGLILFFPDKFINGNTYILILYTHIAIGLILAVMLIIVVKTHALVELSNPFKLGFKKWNGFKLLLYLSLAILTGVIIIVFHIQWVVYFHGFIGLWALLVGWKHKRTNALAKGDGLLIKS